MSTAATVRAVQDQALADGHGAVTVAAYGGLVRTMAHLLGEADADLDGFRDDAVLQAAITEVPEQTRAWMSEWLITNWEWIENASEVLGALDGIEDTFPVIPAGAHAYRRAGQELAHRQGEGCAAVSWAGAAAVARWMRLYGEGDVQTAELAAGDAVLEAARRELADSEKLRVVGFVHEQWELIDAAASERAA